MKATYSINNRVIVEPYKKEELKSEVKNGFALIGQKTHTKGLKLLVDAALTSLGTSPLTIPAGSVVHFREEILHNSPNIKKIMTSPEVDGEFIIMEASLIEFVTQGN